MYLHGELRKTALLYVTKIDSNGAVLGNVEATSMNNITPELYSDLLKIRNCMQ